jgi:hypothetical protein
MILNVVVVPCHGLSRSGHEWAVTSHHITIWPNISQINCFELGHHMHRQHGPMNEITAFWDDSNITAIQVEKLKGQCFGDGGKQFSSKILCAASTVFNFPTNLDLFLCRYHILRHFQIVPLKMINRLNCSSHTLKEEQKNEKGHFKSIWQKWEPKKMPVSHNTS